MNDKPSLIKHRALQILMRRTEAISALELARELGVAKKTAESALRNLCVSGSATVIGCRLNKNNSKTKLYESVGTSLATGKPRREYVPFTGIDWRSSTSRKGCLDHESIPSLRGSRRVAHRAPVPMCDGAAND